MSTYTFHHIKINGIAAAVPKSIRTVHENSSVEAQLHIASPEQTASDLGFVAAKQLLDKYQINKDEIACIIFASLTPDYRSPATAAVLQCRLGIPVDCIAYDLVLGATGFISGIQKAASVLESTNKQYALVVAADTNSKLMVANNPSTDYLGDGGSAVLLEKCEQAEPLQLAFFTLSDQWETMCHKAGGFRAEEALLSDKESLHANKAIVNQLELNQLSYEKTFSDQVVKLLPAFLATNNLTVDQFNEIILQPLSLKSFEIVAAQLNLPTEGMTEVFKQYGNTSASAIPLHLAVKKDTGSKILGLAFGEGLSLAIINFNVASESILPLISTDEVFEEGAVSHIF